MMRKGIRRRKVIICKWRNMGANQYDEDGNEIEQSYYNENGELEWKEKSKYDEEGNKTEESSYNEDEKIRFKRKYQYDEDGNEIEQSYYYADGELGGKEKYQYQYDKLKNWIVNTTYVDDKISSITEREIEYYE